MANAALNAALIVAAQQEALSTTHITGPLRKAGATTRRTAVPLDLSAKGTDKLLTALIKRGHVRSAGADRYWLDEAAITRSSKAGTRAALIIIAFLLSVTASLLALVVS